MSDDSAVSSIVHRLKHLVLEFADVSPAHVELLFGPLIDWIDAADTPTSPNTPKLNLSGMAHKIAERVCYLHDIMLKIKDSVPRVAQFPYMVGVYIDLHFPSMRAVPCTKHTIYRHKLAPEQLSLSTILHDESPVLDLTTLARLWRDDNMLAKNTHTKSGGQRRDRRKLYKSIPFNSLLPAFTPKSVTEEGIFNTAVWRLLSKGRYGITTTRGMKTQYALACQTDLGKRIVRMFMLGAFRHATVIAPPWLRNPDPIAYKSATVITMLGEIITANTRHYSAIRTNMERDTTIHNYYVHATHQADEIRALMYDVPYTSVPAPTEQPVVDTTRLFWTLVSKLNIHSTLRVARLVHLPKSRRDTYRILAMHPHRFKLSGSILRLAGMSDADLETLGRLNTVCGDRPSRHLTRVLSDLSQEGYTLLYVCVDYLVNRARLGVIPIAAHRKVVTVPDADPYMYICGRCHSVLSQCRMVVVEDKSPKRMAMDIFGSDAMYSCKLCYSYDVRRVDMRYNYVFASPPKDVMRQCMFCMCQKCGHITEHKFVIGTVDLCRICYHAVAQLFIPRKCLCGRAMDVKAKAETLIVYRGKRMCMVGLCGKHVGLRRRAPPGVIEDEEFFKCLLENTNSS